MSGLHITPGEVAAASHAFVASGGSNQFTSGNMLCAIAAVMGHRMRVKNADVCWCCHGSGFLGTPGDQVPWEAPR